MAVARFAHSVVSGHTPILTLPGMLAINEADRKLFYRDPVGATVSATLEQFIAKGSVSAAGSVSFVFPASYANFRAVRISLWDIQASISSTDLRLRCSTNGGVSYDSGSNYNWMYRGGTSSNNSAQTPVAFISLLTAITNSANDRAAIELYVPIQTSGAYTNLYYNFVNRGSSANAGSGGGIYYNTGVNAVQLFGGSGNLTARYSFSGVVA